MKMKNERGFGLNNDHHKRRTLGDISDHESIPSDFEGDQWAEIQNYDYNQWIKEKEMAKKEHQRKRIMVRDTLDRQLKEQRDEKLKTI